jgi:hypothetical protein
MNEAAQVDMVHPLGILNIGVANFSNLDRSWSQDMTVVAMV